MQLGTRSVGISGILQTNAKPLQVNSHFALTPAKWAANQRDASNIPPPLGENNHSFEVLSLETVFGGNILRGFGDQRQMQESPTGYLPPHRFRSVGSYLFPSSAPRCIVQATLQS